MSEGDWRLVAAVSLGGGLGSLARYGLEEAFPSSGTGVPWATLAINVSGCALLGALVVAVLGIRPPRRYLRPFLGTGVLGGYTTFSTYAVETHRIADAGAAGIAAAYLLGSLVAGVLAAWLGAAAVRAWLR